MYQISPRPESSSPSPDSQPVEICANSYSIEVTTPVYQYSVSFSPELDANTERRTRDSFKTPHNFKIF